jgi:hypothetical protein
MVRLFIGYESEWFGGWLLWSARQSALVLVAPGEPKKWYPRIVLSQIVQLLPSTWRGRLLHGGLVSLRRAHFARKDTDSG